MDINISNYELADLSADEPAGPNLEFDAAFGELERAAQGKPERQWADKVYPAEDPNWKEVAAMAADLLDRTRDLRVLVHLAVARLHLSGLPEFVPVLGMIRHQLETRWAQVHPQLDPEDNNDPELRANALLKLAEPVRVLRLLRLTTLASSQRDGAVSWRTISVSNGNLEAEPGDEVKTEQVLSEAFRQTGAVALRDRLELIERGIAELNGIGTAFDTNSGYGNAPNLAACTKLLQEMAKYIGQYMPSDLEAEADETASVETVDDAGAGASAGAGAPAAVRGSVATVAALKSVDTRADAMKLLDLVCRYYEDHEPSSPLPLLIGRARRLADKGFLEILQDLAPDGLSQAQTVVQARDQ